MLFRSNSPEDTINIAQKIGEKLKRGDVIAFIGGLGAGKTTFTRGLALGLGLPDDVTSPTFSLVNEYRGKTPLYHFDMYRISSSADLEATGFFDYPLNESVFVIEWAENVLDILPPHTVYITIERIDDNIREIIIERDEQFANSGN